MVTPPRIWAFCPGKRVSQCVDDANIRKKRPNRTTSIVPIKIPMIEAALRAAPRPPTTPTTPKTTAAIPQGP